MISMPLEQQQAMISSSPFVGMKRQLHDVPHVLDCRISLPAACTTESCSKRRRFAKKTVRFQLSRNTATVCAIDAYRIRVNTRACDSSDSTWMSKQQLSDCRNEVRNTVCCYHACGQDVSRMDASLVCLRGLEDILTPSALQQSDETRRQHIRNVVRAHRLLRVNGVAHSDDCLRILAQQSSQNASRVALRRAALDATDFSVLFGL